MSRASGRPAHAAPRRLPGRRRAVPAPRANLDVLQTPAPEAAPDLAPLSPPSPDSGPGLRPAAPLGGLRRAGYVVLGLKLIAFGVWSATLYRHFSLTSDFAQYQQAWYLIAHGHLNPYDTVGNFTFWQNHAEFIMWPVALLYWVFPHGVLLLWLQDAGVVGAEMVAFLWLCELA